MWSFVNFLVISRNTYTYRRVPDNLGYDMESGQCTVVKIQDDHQKHEDQSDHDFDENGIFDVGEAAMLSICEEIEDDNEPVADNHYEQQEYIIEDTVEYELELPMVSADETTAADETDEKMMSQHMVEEERLNDPDEDYDDDEELIEDEEVYEMKTEPSPIKCEAIDGAATLYEEETMTTIAIQSISETEAASSSAADEAFCTYVAHEMKQMSKKNKNLLKQMINNFINELNE